MWQENKGTRVCVEQEAVFMCAVNYIHKQHTHTHVHIHPCAAILLNTQTPQLLSTHSWSFLLSNAELQMSDSFTDTKKCIHGNVRTHTHRHSMHTRTHTTRTHSLTPAEWRRDSLATLIIVNHCRLASLSRLRQCLSEKEGKERRSETDGGREMQTDWVEQGGRV